MSNSEIIYEFQQNLVQTYVTVATITLVFFEYIITLREEISMIWRRKWTLATWLFAANRYFLIIDVILSTVPYTAQTCNGSAALDEAITVLQYVICGLFSALRVFALWDRSIVLLTLVLGLSLIPVGSDIYIFGTSASIFSADPVLGSFCTETNTVSPKTFFNLVLAYRISLIVVDILVLVLTWMKTYRQQREADRLGMNAPLSSMLIRDGTIYFVALFVMNLAHILIENVSSLIRFDIVTYFISTLTPILISRFLLNLKGAASPMDESQNETFNSRFSIPGFRAPTLATITGNMGEPLDYSEENEDSELSGTAHSEFPMTTIGSVAPHTQEITEPSELLSA